MPLMAGTEPRMQGTPAVTLKLLRGETSEMEELQRVLESVPTYTHLVTGVPAGPADAQSVYSILPPNKSYEDKFVFGIHLDGQMIGCIDVIRGYPVPSTAHIGLLVIAQALHRRGLGRTAMLLLAQQIQAWRSCNRLRLGVVRTNAQVLPFWEGLGFRRTGETKPYTYGAITSEVIILECMLPSAIVRCAPTDDTAASRD